MTKPDKSQREYACKRVDFIRDTKVKAYKEEKCLVRPERKLTIKEKEALIFKGGVPFKDGLGTYRSENVFDFSSFENEAEYDGAKLKKYSERMEKEARKAIDAIMLGDSAEIIDVLANFEKV